MNRTTTFFSALAIAGALAACSPDPESSFARGQDAFEQHDFRAARVALIAGLREMPGNAEMRSLLARTQIALGDGEGAITTLDALTSDQRKEPQIAALIGEAEVLRAKYDEALAAVGGVETAAADRVRALALLGQNKIAEAAEAFASGAEREEVDARLFASYSRFELARGDVAKARTLADKSVETDPDSIDGLLAQALVARRQNRLPDALAAYDAALKRHSANFEARLSKAQLLVAMERYSDANVLVGSLLKEAPENGDIAVLRAQIAGSEGKWKEVRAILQPFEGEMRQIPKMRLVYGEALLELGNTAQAIGLLEPMLRANSGARDLRLLVARTQLASGQAQDALDTIELVAIRPDAKPEELEFAAKAAKAIGSAKAAEFARRASEVTPEWVGGELAKADRAMRNRQWESAEVSYEAILDRSGSRNAMVLNNLAYAKSQLGKTDAALAMALEASKLEPDNASILDTAGWLLVQTGSRKRGVEMLSKAAELDPDNAAIAGRLERAKQS